MRGLEAVDDRSFAGRVLNGVRPVLVLFTAPGCHPCELQAGGLSRLAVELAGAVDIACCSVETGRRTASAYHVSQTPTLMLFDDGLPLASHVGLWPLPSIRRWIHATLYEKRGSCRLPNRHPGSNAGEVARAFVRKFFSRATRWRARKIAGPVAPLLLLINHTDLVFREPISVAVAQRLALNFLVPYLVASYSAARAATQHLEGCEE